MSMVHNFKWLFSYQVLRLAIGFLLGAWVARILGPADFGLLSTAAATAGIAYVVIDLGLKQLVAKEISQQRDRERIIVGTALKLWLGSGILVTALVACWNLSGATGPRIPWSLWWAAMLPQTLSCLALHNLWEEASHRAYVAVRNGMVAYLVCAAARLICLLMWPTVSVLAWTIGAETLLLGLLGVRTSYRLGRGWWPRGWDKSIAQKLLTQGSILVVGQVGILLLLRADTVMIEGMRGKAEAGIYAGATRLSEMSYMFASMAVTVLLPKLAERISHTTPERAMQFVRRGSELMIALSLISMIGLWIGGPFVIRLLLGAKYEASIPVLFIHCLSALPYFLNEWRHAVCVAYDRARISALLSWIGLVTNVGLNLVWIPEHGALGAAWATLLAYSACSLVAPWLIPDLRWFARLQLQALFSPFVWISRPRHAWAEFQSMLARNAGVPVQP